MEIDLFFSKITNDKQIYYLIVEVKSLSENSLIEERWSRRQKNRFIKIAKLISESNLETSSVSYLFRFIVVKNTNEIIELAIEDMI